MKKKRIILGIAIALVLAIACLTGIFLASDSGETVTVYFTNDVHGYIDNNIDDENGLTYSKVAALKAGTENALLVDAGDHIQGTAYGGMDEGATIIELMNAAGYDAATLGNHEFDYGMDGCMAVINKAEYPYVSCNFRHELDGVAGELVLNSYVMLECGGKKLAFVGITNPESFTSSRPRYFQDENGKYIYGIAGGDDGSELYAAVQAAIDDATAAGADFVIALGHLGVDVSSGPWTSRNVIANTTGLDALIDGHSQTIIEMETVIDKSENPVVLTQAGSSLDAIGKMTISADGKIDTELLYAEDLAELQPDSAVEEIEERWIAQVNESLGKVIGYSEVVLDNYDSEGNRLVRKQSTNTADFAADALYYFFDEMGLDVDIAIMHGGGIRNEALTGELSYLSCKEIHTFGNLACLLQITGQQLLDALEWGSSKLVADGSAESGGLLHASGFRYTVDISYDSTVQFDDKDVWTGPPTGAYRVKDVQILNRQTGEYEPLDLTKTYNLAGHNYTLLDFGDGFAMFNDAVCVVDYVSEDYMILAKYIQSFTVDETTGLPTIREEDGYGDVYGSGRITILNGN